MSNVKCHYAPALALVVWYLMIPPPSPYMSPPVDLDAPLSTWSLYSEDDTISECEQELVTIYTDAKTELVANPADEVDRLQFHQFESSQCVASDDPRLKEK